MREPSGIGDDVFHDVGGRVINAACILYFRLVINFGVMTFGEPNDPPEKLFIYLTEHVRRWRRPRLQGCCVTLCLWLSPRAQVFWCAMNRPRAYSEAAPLAINTGPAVFFTHSGPRPHRIRLIFETRETRE